jgi:hypothetical protein
MTSVMHSLHYLELQGFLLARLSLFQILATLFAGRDILYEFNIVKQRHGVTAARTTACTLKGLR